MMEEDWVRLAGVGPPQHNDVGVFDLGVRAGATACSEDCRQTDDRRSVSSSIT